MKQKNTSPSRVGSTAWTAARSQGLFVAFVGVAGAAWKAVWSWAVIL